MREIQVAERADRAQARLCCCSHALPRLWHPGSRLLVSLSRLLVLDTGLLSGCLMLVLGRLARCKRTAAAAAKGYLRDPARCRSLLFPTPNNGAAVLLVRGRWAVC